MTWEEIVVLEPRLEEVSQWISSLDPCDEVYDDEAAYYEMKRRMQPLVGWNREVPGFERVPFEYDGDYFVMGDLAKHDKLYRNNERKQALFEKLVPESLRVLYTEEAWDVAWQYLYDGLPLKISCSQEQ